MSMHSTKLLNITDLKTCFDTPEGRVMAVDGVSMAIESGHTLGVLGESGCGKSVTALSIMGLLPRPQGRIVNGSIFFQGRDLARESPQKMRKLRGSEMAMIFQEPMTSLNPVYTVGEQIAESFKIHEHLPKRIGLQKAKDTLFQVGIPSPEQRIHEYPHQLSGGMRQRIMIAMAMACRPKLLIADEPTTALDVTIQAQILDLMLDLQEQTGMSLMMITHDLGVVAEMSDQVVVMYAGKVVEQARVDIIFGAPRHPYTQGLMRSIPRPGRKFSHGKQALQEIPGIVPGLIDPPPGCLFAPRCAQCFERCSLEMPPLFSLQDQSGYSHGVRCWLVESIDQKPATQGGQT